MNDSLLIARIVDLALQRRESHDLIGRWRKRLGIRIEYLRHYLDTESDPTKGNHGKRLELDALTGVLDELATHRLDMRRAHTVLQCALSQLSTQGLESVLREATKVCAPGQPLAPRHTPEETPVLTTQPHAPGEQR